VRTQRPTSGAYGRVLARTAFLLVAATAWGFFAMPMKIAIAILCAGVAIFLVAALQGRSGRRTTLGRFPDALALSFCAGGLVVLWRSHDRVSAAALYGGVLMIVTLAALTLRHWRRSTR
jgi:hypothetical protein